MSQDGRREQQGLTTEGQTPQGKTMAKSDATSIVRRRKQRQSSMAAQTKTDSQVARLVAQHGELEGRLTGNERDLANLTKQVASLAGTVKEGFSDLHTRLDEYSRRQADRGQVNWALVVSMIVASLAIGGVFVGFVVMTTEPIRREMARITEEQSAHEEIVGHRGLIEQQATAAAAFSAMERRLCELNSWRVWWQRTVPAIDAAQTEKLYRLETVVYGHAEKPPASHVPAWPQFETGRDGQ